MQNRTVRLSLVPVNVAVRHLPALDGLRGCAVLMVLALHFSGALVQPVGFPAALVKKVGSFGWIGVDLFFVISGFLITGLLHDARGRRDYFAGFYGRRALRILPLYYGTLFVFFALPWLLGSSGAARYQTPWNDQLWYWLYLQNFHPVSNALVDFINHLWSLAIEEQFYLFWPLIVLLPGRWPLKACAACLILSFGLRAAGLYLITDTRALYFWTFTRLDGLAVGSAVALLARHRDGINWLERLSGPVAWAALFVLVALTIRYRWLHPGAFGVIMVGYLAVALLFGAVLVRVITFPECWLGAVLDFGGLRFFGRYSYALYVFHLPVIALVKRAGVKPENFFGLRSELAGQLGYCLLFGIVTLGCALVSWHLCEKHFLRLKHRLFPRRLPDHPPNTALLEGPLFSVRED